MEVNRSSTVSNVTHVGRVYERRTKDSGAGMVVTWCNVVENKGWLEVSAEMAAELEESWLSTY